MTKLARFVLLFLFLASCGTAVRDDTPDDVVGVDTTADTTPDAPADADCDDCVRCDEFIDGMAFSIAPLYRPGVSIEVFQGVVTASTDTRTDIDVSGSPIWVSFPPIEQYRGAPTSGLRRPGVGEAVSVALTFPVTSSEGVGTNGFVVIRDENGVLLFEGGAPHQRGPVGGALGDHVAEQVVVRNCQGCIAEKCYTGSLEAVVVVGDEGVVEVPYGTCAGVEVEGAEVVVCSGLYRTYCSGLRGECPPEGGQMQLYALE